MLGQCEQPACCPSNGFCKSALRHFTAIRQKAVPVERPARVSAGPPCHWDTEEKLTAVVVSSPGGRETFQRRGGQQGGRGVQNWEGGRQTGGQ